MKNNLIAKIIFCTHYLPQYVRSTHTYVPWWMLFIAWRLHWTIM